MAGLLIEDTNEDRDDILEIKKKKTKGDKTPKKELDKES